ncbi:hypothetical protein L228DRAFT_285938 [Xylona heveae TC161]|uniref:Uncharacterized protein n=1 Tax=Xylona heveae (strain CBS 132557 / TC161) TaxID=1328760 RepID=A0A164ZUE5_XYLHT|nr:hypothetical protein L228DRAFT_285938 [Xylona heveae TC161]KZF19535.1 hypothetical protein L228DRAFT_285938 [Xylona heveae TC161]
MTVLADDWTAVTPDEKSSKAAFEKAFVTGPERVIQDAANPDGGTKKKFILQTGGYYDLHTYVMSGMELPKTNAAFEAKMAKSAFSELINIDAEIYDQTRDTIVGISDSCHGFNDKTLGKLVVASNAAISYCKEAIDSLQDEEDINLKAHLDVLLDEKYKKPENIDEDYKAARESALAVLDNLKEEAEKKKKETDQIILELTAFKNKTILDKDMVDFLHKQYETGPVTTRSTGTEKKDANGNKQQPYATFLDAEATKALNDYNDAVTKSKKEWDKWVRATAIAATTAWFGPLGWIAMGIETDEAIKARAAYEAQESKKNESQSKRADIVKLLKHVKLLTFQFNELIPKMSSAIEAMGELSMLFSTQAESYETLGTHIKNIAKGAKAESWRTRKAWISKRIEKAVGTFKEILQAAEEFRASTNLQKKMPGKA